MPSPVLQFKRGSSTNVGVTSFRAGEPGFTTDKYDFYIGLDNTAANNKFFGSSRYWTREDGSTSVGLNLVDKNGVNKIVLKSPNTLAGDTTYTLPATPTDNYFLKTNSSGDLTWAEVVSTFNIAADSGTSDNVSTGSTITFSGGTNINTVVTDNTITINLDTDLNNLGIVTATTFDGNASTSSQVKTIATSTNANYYVTFVDSNNGTAIAENVYTDSGIYYNPSTNTLYTDNGQFGGYIKVGGNDIRSGAGSTAIVLSVTDVEVVGNLQVTGNLIKSSTGATVATLSANDVSFADDVTVGGNLYVMGQTTEVETTNLKVQDSLIDLGLIKSGTVLVPPTSDLNIDLGILLNWYNGGAKKAAVYWDDSAQRIGIASDVSESSNVLTANAYAAVEIGSLWVTDCAGTSEVITCTGAERFLQNITVDCGTF